MSKLACVTLQQFLSSELKKAQYWHKALLNDNDPENVHQLRISLRKLRSALMLSQPIIKPRYRKRWQKQLRVAAKQLDTARDLDVFLLSIDSQSSSDKTLQARLRKQQKTAYKILRKNLREGPFLRWRKLKKQLKQKQWIERRCRQHTLTLKTFASQQLMPIYSEIQRAQKQMRTLDNNALHQLRIHCKRLRYGCEFVASALDTETTSDFLSALRHLQDNLGDLHDANVQQTLIANASASLHKELVQKKVTAQDKQKLDAELRRFLALSRPWS